MPAEFLRGLVDPVKAARAMEDEPPARIDPVKAARAMEEEPAARARCGPPDPNEDALAALYDQTDGVEIDPVASGSLHADIDPVGGLPTLWISIAITLLILVAIAVATVNPWHGAIIALSAGSAVGLGFVGQWLGAMRGNGVAGFWFGFLLGPIGLLIACLIPDQRTSR